MTYDIEFSYNPARSYKRWTVKLIGTGWFVERPGQSIWEALRLCCYEAEEFGFIK